MPILEEIAVTLPRADLDLDETLDCGQCFRWERQEDGSYTGIVRGRFCRVERQGDRVLFHGVDEDDFQRVWRPYFDLDRDYGSLKAQFSCDPILAEAARFAPGIRILRQEPWEALCSFILSQNNNIKRIKGLVARLCAHFGDPVEGGFSFPTPERLAPLSPEDLAPVRCGFRAGYVLDAARRVASGQIDLDAVAAMDIDDAREVLQQIHGVGPKVAECALLYGFGRMECCPMDVWMKKCISTLFPCGLPPCSQGVEGIAQQYLFHYSRCHPVLFR
ncbi:DNA-3-methyladenine glycosylase family protein [Zongyangia hominis]|uniref:DNA-3-methyladenine glycosylase family protein n=1 Tax=Zongyangia hominis TaxID=2763677 RepID=UPI0021CC5BBA|nr:DNA glycosylase [Zongyangia hominis]